MKKIFTITSIILMLAACSPPVLVYYANNIKTTDELNSVIKGEDAIVKSKMFKFKIWTYVRITKLYLRISIENNSKEDLIFDINKICIIIPDGRRFYPKIYGVGKSSKITVIDSQKQVFDFGVSLKGIYSMFTVNFNDIKYNDKNYSFEIAFKAKDEEFVKYIKRFPWANDPENQEAIEKAITEQEGNITK